jgi:hypothetical protein
MQHELYSTQLRRRQRFPWQNPPNHLRPYYHLKRSGSSRTMINGQLSCGDPYKGHWYETGNGKVWVSNGLRSTNQYHQSIISGSSGIWVRAEEKFNERRPKPPRAGRIA